MKNGVAEGVASDPRDTITGAPLARRAGPSHIRPLKHGGAPPLPLLHSISQNSGKTAGLNPYGAPELGKSRLILELFLVLNLD